MREKKPVNIKIGKNLKEAREEAGYTQEALSELVDITPNHLSAIERGVCGLSSELLKKLCEVLKISSDALIFGKFQSDDITMELAQKLSKVKPKRRPQLYKVLDVLEEIFSLDDDESK